MKQKIILIVGLMVFVTTHAFDTKFKMPVRTIQPFTFTAKPPEELRATDLAKQEQQTRENSALKAAAQQAQQDVNDFSSKFQIYLPIVLQKQTFNPLYPTITQYVPLLQGQISLANQRLAAINEQLQASTVAARQSAASKLNTIISREQTIATQAKPLIDAINTFQKKETIARLDNYIKNLQDIKAYDLMTNINNKVYTKTLSIPGLPTISGSKSVGEILSSGNTLLLQLFGSAFNLPKDPRPAYNEAVAEITKAINTLKDILIADKKNIEEKNITLPSSYLEDVSKQITQINQLITQINQSFDNTMETFFEFYLKLVYKQVKKEKASNVFTDAVNGFIEVAETVGKTALTVAAAAGSCAEVALLEAAVAGGSLIEFGVNTITAGLKKAFEAFSNIFMVHSLSAQYSLSSMASLKSPKFTLNATVFGQDINQSIELDPSKLKDTIANILKEAAKNL